MKEIREILAIFDPTRAPALDQQPAVERAVNLAASLGARVEVFVCDYNQYLSGERFFDSPGLQKARDSYISNRKKQITRLAEKIKADGADIRTDTVWDSPLDQGIVRKVLRSKPDLVVKEIHRHPRLQRAIFTNTDWHLVRNCPAPLLFVRKGEGHRGGPVIGSVDPMHDNDKPAQLDAEIIALGSAISTGMKREFHLFHAYQPTALTAGGVPGAPEPVVLPMNFTDEMVKAAHAREFAALCEKHDVPASRAHLRQGDTREELFELIDELKASLVVMGAVSRGRLKRIFLGSTAEKVLADIISDVLIVKPPGFASPVAEN